MNPLLWGDLQNHFDGRTINFTSFFNFLSWQTFEGVAGVAPELWNVTNVTFDGTDAFANNSIDSLTNWNDIPAAWGGPA